MPTTPAPSQDKITADELRRAFESINARIDALTETLNTIMQGISHAATATPPAAGQFGEMEIVSIVKSIDKNDKANYLAMGAPYSKFGVRVWDEILPAVGIDPASLEFGNNVITPGIRVRVLLGETTNRKTGKIGIGPHKVTGKM